MTGPLCFDGAVLCGGASTRMGADKATIAVGGVPMARRVAEALRVAGARQVTAVGGDVAALRDMGIDAEPDEHPGAGPLGATVQALGTTGRCPAVAVLACDLVRPDSTTVATLVRLREAADADVLVPVAGGRPQWVHGIWHRRVAGVLGDLFRGGERSLARVSSEVRVELVDVPDASVLTDADLPGELPAGAVVPEGGPGGHPPGPTRPGSGRGDHSG